MKDPYAVLGVDRNADRQALKEKYETLRALYSEQRFKSGEEGNEGARKLQELEEAWVVISANLDREEIASASGDGYGRVDELIRAGKYNEAQEILDSISDRRGEWHYMQAIVFYKREWLTEAKTQLEMALKEDPESVKYRSSLEKLKIAMAGGEPSQPRSATPGGAPVGDGTYNTGDVPPDVGGDNMANWLSTCCCAYCLTDCLCSAMRCC